MRRRRGALACSLLFLVCMYHRYPADWSTKSTIDWRQRCLCGDTCSIAYQIAVRRSFHTRAVVEITLWSNRHFFRRTMFCGPAAFSSAAFICLVLVHARRTPTRLEHWPSMSQPNTYIATWFKYMSHVPFPRMLTPTSGLTLGVTTSRQRCCCCVKYAELLYVWTAVCSLVYSERCCSRTYAKIELHKPQLLYFGDKQLLCPEITQQ